MGRGDVRAGRNASGGGRSPGATTGAPRRAAGAPQPRPGRSGQGSRWGWRGGGGWPHRSSREAGAARIPQLLRRMLFRVGGGRGGVESNGGRKEPRAKRGLVSCAGGGLR